MNSIYQAIVLVLGVVAVVCLSAAVKTHNQRKSRERTKAYQESIQTQVVNDLQHRKDLYALDRSFHEIGVRENKTFCVNGAKVVVISEHIKSFTEKETVNFALLYLLKNINLSIDPNLYNEIQNKLLPKQVK